MSTPGGYVQTALLAAAEEVLFRGLLAGWLMRRLGIAAGNLLQALAFLAPHLLLLLISTAFWPLLPVQFAAGWLLGLLRYKSGSIGPPALAHAAANILAALPRWPEIFPVGNAPGIHKVEHDRLKSFARQAATWQACVGKTQV